MVEVVGLTGVNSSTLNEASFKNEYFSQHFWREKNHGFAVLYQNMKHGQICVKYLQDFIRESATSEDVHGKHLSKLTKHAVNPCTLGSSAPMFEVLRTTTDKLSSCHMDIVFKLHDIIKDLSKYLDEQRIKHKQVKDEVSGTLYSLHCVQSTAATVQKSKDKYHQLCMEVEKMKRIGSLQKDVIKVEGKRIKAADEYKMALDKYSTIRNEYEQKMSESIKRFQEIEVAHLKRMKSFLDKYILSFENTSVLISQVHQEFRELVNDNTIDTLIKQYWDTNGTCTEKPSVLVFEECDAAAKLEAYEPTSNGDATTAGGATPPISKGSKRPIMPFKKRKAPKQPKETSNLEMAKEVEKKPKDPPDEDTITVIIDEDGFTIRPEIRKMSRNSWGSESSDDSDDFLTRRINVKINPKDEQTSGSGSDIETLNSVVRNLTLNSPSPMAAKKQTVNTKSEKEVLDAFDDDLDKPLSDDYSEGGGSGIAGRMDEVKNGSSSNSPNNIPSSTIATRPNKLSLSNVEVEVQKASSTSSAPLATCEIWSPATPQDKTSTTSRNLTPIIHVQGNPIPVAAAFTETIHAYFKGANTNRCLVKITGELQISFPANMVKSLTSNPHPPVLSFKVKKGESVKDFQPNQNLLVSNLSQSDESTRIFSCDMTSLVSHIKRKAETNPDSLYFNVQVLTYQFISHSGYDMTPLQVTSHWKCDADHTNVCVEYKYNPNYTSKALQNVQVIVPIDGKVTKTDSSPSATWVSSQNRLVWKLATVSENNPSGVLESNLSLASGPSKPTALAVQFSSEGSTLSGVDFELVGLGYRLSLVKKRYVSGKYVAEGL